MRLRNVCVLVAVAIGFAATVAQADYVDSVLAHYPFLYLRLQETGAAHMTTAANSGVSGANGTYYQSGGTGGSFSDIDSMIPGLTPAKQFNRDSEDSGASIGGPAQGGSYGSLTSFTIEGMLKPANYDGLKRILCTTTYFGGEGNMHVNLSGGNLELAMSERSGISMPLSSLLPAGQWAHIALTYEAVEGNGIVKCYFNGALLNPGGTTNGAASFVNFNQDFAVGAWYGGGPYYDGGLDELAVYDHALSATAIAGHAATLVPEPSTVALLAAGLFGLLCYAWRKRKCVPS